MQGLHWSDDIGSRIINARPARAHLLVQAIVANPMPNGEVIRFDGAIRMVPQWGDYEDRYNFGQCRNCRCGTWPPLLAGLRLVK
jgi:hypothetical protein